MARNKLAGQPRPPEVRAKISASQQARYARARAAHPIPETKRCPKCRRYLPSPKSFGWRKTPLKNGEVSWHPRSWCKDCTRAKSRKYRNKLRAEGTLTAKQRKWNENRRKKKEASIRRHS